jgi:hypothetical protein
MYMALKRYERTGVPAASPLFRAKSWRAFEFALDPLARARSLPPRRPAGDHADLVALWLALALS